MLQNITALCIELHYITLHYIIIHYIKLYCIMIHYITVLHYITIQDLLNSHNCSVILHFLFIRKLHPPYHNVYRSRHKSNKQINMLYILACMFRIQLSQHLQKCCLFCSLFLQTAIEEARNEFEKITCQFAVVFQFGLVSV